MQPWERRLNDLWLLLERCHATYMEPDLFRLNTNQFLQTSRTVTFIVQKHKDAIPSFNDWYQAIIEAWASDGVMNWAKDSRNKIEKEGDLDLHSTLELRLLFSYLAEQDAILATGRNEFLQAGTKRLVRLARRQLPSHVIDAAAIKIERRWVANTLPDWELLHAFSYVYSTLYRMCQQLAERLGAKIDSAIPDPIILYPVREAALQVRYLKLSDLKFHYQHTQRVAADPGFEPPAPIASAGLRDRFTKAASAAEILNVLGDMAEIVFKHDGFHMPMIYMFDANMKAVDFMSGAWADQVEKFIFWRNIADRFVAAKAKYVASIGESWIRDLRQYQFNPKPVHKLPIIGERLFVNVFDSTGAFRSKNWEIVRPGENAKPTLKHLPDDEFNDKMPFCYAPILRAIGLPYPAHFYDESDGQVVR